MDDKPRDGRSKPWSEDRKLAHGRKMKAHHAAKAKQRKAAERAEMKAQLLRGQPVKLDDSEMSKQFPDLVRNCVEEANATRDYSEADLLNPRGQDDIEVIVKLLDRKVRALEAKHWRHLEKLQEENRKLKARLSETQDQLDLLGVMRSTDQAAVLKLEDQISRMVIVNK
jgi:hypothetical protein